MSNYSKLSVLGGAAFIALGGFAAGWAAGGSAFATSFNAGLVTALNSVGQNLFGTAVFGASPHVPNPGPPDAPVRLDIGDNTQLPITLNVFTPTPDYPPNPCRSYLQVAIAGGVAVLKVDYDAAPAGFSTDIVEADLSDVHPATSQCPAPVLEQP